MKTFASWGEAYAWDAVTPRATGIGPQWVGAHCTEGCRSGNHTESCEWYAFAPGLCRQAGCDQAHRSTVSPANRERDER